ncbi:MAG: L-aspartate oxidase [Elusimicrobiota bacterium]
MSIYKSDFLVIGTGLAGLLTAYRLSRSGTVSLVSKRGAQVSNTDLAQGGIAAVTGKDDAAILHINDTLKTGSGLADRHIVEIAVREGPERVKELVKFGVRFTKKGSDFELGLEGGHSRRRILHAADSTGHEIESALLQICRANKKIHFYENHAAVDLILDSRPAGVRPERNAARGAYVLEEHTGVIHSFLASTTVLASGGAGKVYLYTSNPDTATGDGMAMAYRAGLRLINMEFVQFHPTCLYHPKAKSFLISEAVRGEGAILRSPDGKPFMAAYDIRRELAPRDIVARAIDSELKKSGAECVYLDITARPAAFIKKRFPNIYKKCMSFGIDITKDPIPVVPAAHFFCGGIEADEWGRTALPGLYAVGEVAHTGLHGANRLASNSLLEACVFARRAAVSICGISGKKTAKSPAKAEVWNYGNARHSDEAVMITHNWDEVRTLMWNYVGIVRSDKRLERAKARIRIITEEIAKYYWDFLLTRDLLELRNIACLAEAIIRSATERRESRGLHFNINYPQTEENFAANTKVDRYDVEGSGFRR